MIELQAADFPSLHSHLAELYAGAPIAGAVLSGHTRGKAFVRAAGDLHAAFVYDNGFCVMAGAPADAAFASKCLDWLLAHPEQDFFILYPGGEDWVPLLDGLAIAPITKMQRVAFRFDPAAFAAQRVQQALPAQFSLRRMDTALMRRVADGTYPFLAGMWQSAARFEQDGVGYCVLAADRVVSFCYSVFVHGRHHEVDIMTVDGFRRLGLARAAASAFIDECLARGFEPGWECFRRNDASYRLAESLGFQPNHEFPVYFWQRTR
jgi:RimJ/RimL family protein N-acetyltransferase